MRKQSMIETQLDLIERLIQKTKTFGICWACINRFECRDKASKDDKDEFASGCVDFDERSFLDSYNL